MEKKQLYKVSFAFWQLSSLSVCLVCQDWQLLHSPVRQNQKVPK